MSELTNNKITNIFEEGNEYWVLVSELTAKVDLSKRDYWISQLQKTIDDWGKDTDWKTVSLIVKPTENGTQQATFTRVDKKNIEEKFFYLVNDLEIIPQRWEASR